MTLPLNGRVALVTGANHGIGAATASALASLGANVAVTYLRLPDDADDPGRPAAYGRDRAQDAEEVLARMAPTGVSGVAIEADLRDPSSAAMVFDRVELVLGGVDILVNNASGWKKDTFGPAAQDWIGRDNTIVSAATADAQYLVDARGGALMIAEFATRHRARGANWGRIINVASVHGLVGSAQKSAYVAAKHGIVGLTKVTALENATTGVTCNAICPGWVLTPLVQKQVDAKAAEHGISNEEAKKLLLGEKEPSMQFTTPEELGELAVFFCSPAANNVRGVAWNMDGGWAAQ